MSRLQHRKGTDFVQTSEKLEKNIDKHVQYSLNRTKLWSESFIVKLQPYLEPNLNELEQTWTNFGVDFVFPCHNKNNKNNKNLTQDQGRKWSAWEKVFGWNNFLVENILGSKKNFGQKYLRVKNIF